MSESIDDTKKVIVPMMDDMCSKLGEHVDTVQIFVTKNTADGKGGTITVARGTGDWYSRYGFVSYWIESQKGYARRTGETQHDNDCNDPDRP